MYSIFCECKTYEKIGAVRIFVPEENIPEEWKSQSEERISTSSTIPTNSKNVKKSKSVKFEKGNKISSSIEFKELDPSSAIRSKVFLFTFFKNNHLFKGSR